MRNKVASVAVGVCAVTLLPLAFAALCAQDAALPGCNAATAPSMPHRLRTGSAVNATATATLPRCHATAPRYAATQQRSHDATHRHEVVNHHKQLRQPPPPIFAGAVASPLCPHGPGALPRTHKGLPLARSKLGFGTALLVAKNNEQIKS